MKSNSNAISKEFLSIYLQSLHSKVALSNELTRQVVQSGDCIQIHLDGVTLLSDFWVKGGVTGPKFYKAFSSPNFASPLACNVFKIVK